MSTPDNPLFNAVLFNSALFGGPGIPPDSGAQVGLGLLYPALRKAGVTLAPGRTPSPAQFQDAIDELNRLIGMLNCDRLFIYAEDNWIFPIFETKMTYTIGPDPNADFVAPRPQLITRASYVDLQNSESPLHYQLAILTPQVWNAITDRTLVQTIPDGLYNDRAYPVSTLYLYGQPPAGNNLELWVWHQVQKFTSVTDYVLLPKQYEDCLVLNLACRLAPQFQKVVPPDVRDQARESLMHLRSINAPQPIARFPGICGGYGYNVYSDQDN